MPAAKFVTATPWQPVSQPLQQSGTSPEMMAHQQMSLHAALKWFGGGMTGVVAGSKALMDAHGAAILHDGGLVMHYTTPCYVVVLSLSCLS